MYDTLDERRWARRMLAAAIRLRTECHGYPGTDPRAAAELAALLDDALDTGLGRTELMVELAALAGELVVTTAPEDVAALVERIGPPTVGSSAALAH